MPFMSFTFPSALLGSCSVQALSTQLAIYESCLHCKASGGRFSTEVCVELDCSGRLQCSGVSWRVTCEISRDKDSVNALQDLCPCL